MPNMTRVSIEDQTETIKQNTNHKQLFLSDLNVLYEETESQTSSFIHQKPNVHSENEANKMQVLQKLLHHAEGNYELQVSIQIGSDLFSLSHFFSKALKTDSLQQSNFKQQYQQQHSNTQPKVQQTEPIKRKKKRSSCVRKAILSTICQIEQINNELTTILDANTETPPHFESATASTESFKAGVILNQFKNSIHAIESRTSVVNSLESIRFNKKHSHLPLEKLRTLIEDDFIRPIFISFLEQSTFDRTISPYVPEIKEWIRKRHNTHSDSTIMHIEEQRI